MQNQADKRKKRKDKLEGYERHNNSITDREKDYF